MCVGWVLSFVLFLSHAEAGIRAPPVSGVQSCALPISAANACTVVRIMLLSGCCAVKVTPAGWVWKRHIHERRFFAPNLSRMILAHILRAARNLAIS